MAATAQRDSMKRTVKVNREELLKTLIENRKQHQQDYKEAVEGYKALLLEKIEEGFKKASEALCSSYDKAKSEAQKFDVADIEDQSDWINLFESQGVHLAVPRCYTEEYDSAIAMAEWDTREVLELTHAEFTCFVRDKWNWKSDFDVTSTIYKAAAVRAR